MVPASAHFWGSRHVVLPGGLFTAEICLNVPQKPRIIPECGQDQPVQRRDPDPPRGPDAAPSAAGCWWFYHTFLGELKGVVKGARPESSESSE